MKINAFPKSIPKRKKIYLFKYLQFLKQRRNNKNVFFLNDVILKIIHTGSL